MRQYRANLASHGLCITSYETDTGKAPERPTKFRRRHDEKRSPWNKLSRGGRRSRREPVSISENSLPAGTFAGKPRSPGDEETSSREIAPTFQLLGRPIP